MAVVNQYKFYGKATTAAETVSMLSPAVNETIIIKSILVTSAGTPSVTVLNNNITAIKSVALTANQTKELLTQPLIVEGGSAFTIQSSTTDSFDYGVSFLNIKKEKID